MNNQDVEQELNRCQSELNQVKQLIDSLGLASSISPYLTKYSIIRACGVIETSFKSIIADFCSLRSKRQVKRFISKRVREGSANPSLDNIYKFLGDFDSVWKDGLKAKINLEPNRDNLRTSIESLVSARNEFAHGGNPNVSITDILTYFQHSRRIIELLDEVVQ